MQPAWKIRRQSRPCFLHFSEHMDVSAAVIKDDFFFFDFQRSLILYIFPQNGKPVSVMVFIIFRGESSVAIYNTIICLSYINYRNYKKTIQSLFINIFWWCMICFFNGQGSQPIQPFLPQAAPQVGLNEFQFRKGSLGCCPVTCNVINNSRAVHISPKVDVTE